ncbi:PREDICTED: sodium channel protein Nach-like [Polistes canadensis]|uniref:sodium channel protein Nach-like n=1 Tax=Polistes canadensis TaxID=91411 RepID=UPI000718F52C|nr:PREDICTED: sodium channel protein Nach-like [Polistes canadensis]
MKRLRKKNEKRDSSESKKIFWIVLRNQAREFCLATGLHGYKYVAQSQRSKIERIIWAIVLFASFCCAIVLMKIAWDYYASHPTLTVIETTHRGIWNYPFPAVTICNINRISLNLTRSLVDMLNHPSNISKEFLVQEFRLLLELLDPGVFEQDVAENLTRLQNILDDNRLTIPEVMEKVTRNCSDLLKLCKWNDDSFDCNKFFIRSLTRDGLCCSFNYVSSYHTKNSIDLQPRRIPACGYQTGLAVSVNPDPNDYLATFLGSFGVKVLVHYPYDYPDHNANDKLIDLNKQAFLSIAPEETYATLDVKDLAISTRNCVFSDEGDRILNNKNIEYRRLTSEKYSYVNCMAECRANTIKKKCDCIPYYFPPSEVRVCNLKDVKCLSIHRCNLVRYVLAWKKHRRGASKSGKKLKRDRQETLRMCSRFNELSPSRSNQRFVLFSLPSCYYIFRKYKGFQNQSIIHVFFSDLVAIQYRRSVHYNWRNLFASFGGLLGLFVGFSLMSGFELIYFFIIRIITDKFVKDNQENRAKSRIFACEIQQSH